MIEMERRGTPYLGESHALLGVGMDVDFDLIEWSKLSTHFVEEFLVDVVVEVGKCQLSRRNHANVMRVHLP